MGGRAHRRAAHRSADGRGHAHHRRGPDRGRRVVHPRRRRDPRQLHPLQRGGADARGGEPRTGRDGVRQLLRCLGGSPPPLPRADEAGADVAASDVGLVINEIAAQGDPLDWFELYNSSDAYLALANFVVADDLADPGKRVAFPSELVIPPGGYVQIQLDKDGWPGFALGRDEELGIWTAGGTLVAEVDWDDGQADEGTSYARVPDVTGDFQTVGNPTPGAANQPDN
ncbi:MAG: lamin tail domain-containing protein [Chloroflexi bacterium]|nr:lamin tail domain-containing protein [Chloroflexota bacterium]